MKRFYRQSLAATWMAKHFDIRFMIDGPEDGFISIEPVNIGTWGEQTKYYIDPESLHLLEPQVGDTVATGEDVFIISPDHHEYRARSQFRLLSELKSDFEIIRRNGINFMWPESDPE